MAWDDKQTKVWFDGELVDWKDANISVLSHVVHYGTSVFEGIRAYKNDNGVAVFRLEEHVQRLFDSAKVYKMDIPFTQDEIAEAILETVRVNDLDGCYRQLGRLIPLPSGRVRPRARRRPRPGPRRIPSAWGPRAIPCSRRRARSARRSSAGTRSGVARRRGPARTCGRCRR